MGLAWAWLTTVFVDLSMLNHCRAAFGIAIVGVWSDSVPPRLALAMACLPAFPPQLPPRRKRRSPEALLRLLPWGNSKKTS